MPNIEEYISNVRYHGLTTEKIGYFRSDTVAAAVGTAGIIFGKSTGSTVGIYFGVGVPSVLAPQGSIYLRTDGAGAATRLYVTTDNAGTWTSITAAA